MKIAYERCGEDPVVEAEIEWALYDDSNGAKAMSDVTTGFTKWVTTYLNCDVRRMQKWNQKFQNY